VFKFQHDVLTRALEGTGALGRPGFRYSSVFSFVKISLVRPQPKARVRPQPKARPSNLRAQTAPAMPKINFQDYKCASRWHQSCRWKTSARSRFVGSSRASRCLPVPFYLWYRNQSTRARGKLIALEVPVVVISSPNAMKVYRSPLAVVRATRAKLCGSEARRRKFRSGDS
jgi:hypothetical protein